MQHIAPGIDPGEGEAVVVVAIPELEKLEQTLEISVK
jgi:hypothetical protein